MPVMKRATRKLRERGIKLTVKRGLWGYYLDDPALASQRSRTYATIDQCIAAALAGERPTPLPDSETKE